MTHHALLGKLDYFKKVSLFRNLKDEQIERIVSIMQTEQFDEGEFVFREGSSGATLYILLQGEVEISKSLVLPQWIQSSQKQEKSLLRLTEQHYPFFGEMAIFVEGSERSASIRAVTSCQMAGIGKEELENMLNNDPAMGMIIYRNIATELVVRLGKANRDVLKLTTAFTLALEG
jgi:CRP-like cAMP-binding protein